LLQYRYIVVVVIIFICSNDEVFLFGETKLITVKYVLDYKIDDGVCMCVCVTVCVCVCGGLACSLTPASISILVCVCVVNTMSVENKQEVTQEVAPAAGVAVVSVSSSPVDAHFGALSILKRILSGWSTKYSYAILSSDHSETDGKAVTEFATRWGLPSTTTPIPEFTVQVKFFVQPLDKNEWRVTFRVSYTDSVYVLSDEEDRMTDGVGAIIHNPRLSIDHLIDPVMQLKLQTNVEHPVAAMEVYDNSNNAVQV
jgi:28 kDa A-kinase anchor